MHYLTALTHLHTSRRPSASSSPSVGATTVVYPAPLIIWWHIDSLGHEAPDQRHQLCVPRKANKGVRKTFDTVPTNPASDILEQ